MSAPPIENIYYLLCYAYGTLDDIALAPTGSELGTRIENLFAHVLIHATERLLRRGLAMRYLDVTEDLRGVRGKIRMGDTASRALMRRSLLSCEHAELSADILENRILKSAIHALRHEPRIDPAYRRKLAEASRLLHEVTDVPLAGVSFGDLSIHLPRRDYALALAVARLLAEGALPHPSAGERQFTPFEADAQKMGLVFEDFIRGFISIERPDARLLARRTEWLATASDTDLRLLPQLERDVPVLLDGQRLIIECKYYANPFVAAYGVAKLNSSHLYQLYSYLMNDRPEARGLLLYAAVDQPVDAEFVLGGRHLQVRTLNLNQPWQRVHEELLGVLARSRSEVQAGASC